MTLELAAEPVPLYWAEKGQVIRVAGTRISLDNIVIEFQDRRTPEQIAERFPGVSLADVHAVIAYYLRHKEEVDAYIAERERQADEFQRKIESDPEYQAFIQRVLATRKERGL